MVKSGHGGGKTGPGKRLKALRSLLNESGLDALLVTDIKNIRYLSGFTGSSAYIVLTAERAWFLTDSRYTVQAGEEVTGFKLKICKKAFDEITVLVTSLRLKSLGFESNHVSYDFYRKFAKALKGIRLKPAAGIIEKLRIRKDASEIGLIKDAARVLDLGYGTAMEVLLPGAVEREAALEIELALRKAGAEGSAFDTIIASGFRGALPHGKAAQKKVKKGELVVVDMGVLKNGYNSDETRTFCIGRSDALKKKVYRIVKDAQALAIDKIRPGIPASMVDNAARSYIERSGYGKFFGHGTGHGVGLDVHEAPAVGPGSKDILEEGMVITIEPGIYLPGEFGVRIEDMAVVVREGCEIITKTPKELICI